MLAELSPAVLAMLYITMWKTLKEKKNSHTFIAYKGNLNYVLLWASIIQKGFKRKDKYWLKYPMRQKEVKKMPNKTFSEVLRGMLLTHVVFL